MEEAMNGERVSYAGKRVYIGLDVHRAFFVASCVCEGVVVKRCRMPSRSESVISLIRKYFSDCEVRTCYEAGYSGFWLHRELEAAGVSNIVVHAASIEVAANDRVKTDKRDSLKMAMQLSAGRLKGIRVPSLEQEYRRLLPRTREQVMRAKRRVQIQIRMRLHQFGLFPPEIERVIRLKDVEELLMKLDGDLQYCISCLYSEWQQLVSQVKEIDRQLRRRAKEDPLDAIYQSVPGIGPLVAQVLLSELGNMSQFPNERALFRFTGLTPGEYSSGGKIHRGHISRQGSSRLRHMLVEAAWKAIRKDSVLREFFERIAKKAGKKRAIVAVARKLVGRVRAAIRNSALFEVGHKRAA
jgi:transposase